MKSFTISIETIKEVRDGHCILWNYDYKEYVFNDQYTEAYSLRIPQNAVGVKAQMLGNGAGIADEFDCVYLDDGGNVKRLFNLGPDLSELAAPLIDYLKNNYNPRCAVVVTFDTVRVVADVISVPVTLGEGDA